MKITKVSANNRKKAFEVHTRKGMYSMPYAVLDVVPSSEDRVTNVSVDHELGNEGFTYQLKSGLEGTVHIDHRLDYNQDPN